MSQYSNYNQLKRILLKIKNNIIHFYNNYIKIPCINLYNYFFIPINNVIIIDVSHNLTTSNNEIELSDTKTTKQTLMSDKIDEELTVTKRISYSDNSSNDFQEVSIHRPSISMYINPDYINKSE
jgi:hypothetical protein